MSEYKTDWQMKIYSENSKHKSLCLVCFQCEKAEHTCDQSGRSFSCDGLAMSSMYVLRKPVRPMSSANFAGGLFSSRKPQTKMPEGTMKLAYQKYLLATKPRFVPDPPPDPPSPPLSRNFAARSFRAARSAILSCAVTGLFGLTILAASVKRRERLTLVVLEATLDIPCAYDGIASRSLFDAIMEGLECVMEVLVCADCINDAARSLQERLSSMFL